MQELPAQYLERRREWFTTSATYAAALGLKDEVVVDSLLLLDRCLAAGEGATSVPPALLVLSCLLISARQGGKEGGGLWGRGKGVFCGSWG